MWEAGFDNHRTTAPRTVTWMDNMVNIKASQFKVWFSREVRFWNEADIYIMLYQCYLEEFLMLE